MISDDLHNLKLFFQDNPVAALCFSGGAASSYLLYAGQKYGRRIKAYYVKTEFQSQTEMNDALRIAEILHADICVLEASILSVPNVSENKEDRCYFCKTAMVSLIQKKAKEDGFPLLIDGSIESGDKNSKFLRKSLFECSVLSPLRECGLSKLNVRVLSKKVGLFTWSKPSFACLATRVPPDTPITIEMLKKIEHAEIELTNIGFTDFRIKMIGNTAKLQIPIEQMPIVLEKRERIIKSIKPNFDSILLDLEGRS